MRSRYVIHGAGAPVSGVGEYIDTPFVLPSISRADGTIIDPFAVKIASARLRRMMKGLRGLGQDDGGDGGDSGFYSSDGGFTSGQFDDGSGGISDIPPIVPIDATSSDQLPELPLDISNFAVDVIGPAPSMDSTETGLLPSIPFFPLPTPGVLPGGPGSQTGNAPLPTAGSSAGNKNTPLPQQQVQCGQGTVMRQMSNGQVVCVNTTTGQVTQPVSSTSTLLTPTNIMIAAVAAIAVVSLSR